MANKVEAILEEIKGLTLLEAADLVKKMEEAFGVSAAAAAPGGTGGRPAAGRGCAFWRVTGQRRLRQQQPAARRRAAVRRLKKRRNSPSCSPKSVATRST